MPPLSLKQWWGEVIINPSWDVRFLGTAVIPMTTFKQGRFISFRRAEINVHLPHYVITIPRAVRQLAAFSQADSFRFVDKDISAWACTWWAERQIRYAMKTYLQGSVDLQNHFHGWTLQSRRWTLGEFYAHAAYAKWCYPFNMTLIYSEISDRVIIYGWIEL